MNPAELAQQILLGIAGDWTFWQLRAIGALSWAAGGFLAIGSAPMWWREW